MHGAWQAAKHAHQQQQQQHALICIWCDHKGWQDPMHQSLEAVCCRVEQWTNEHLGAGHEVVTEQL
jgi:hypothetical protein